MPQADSRVPPDAPVILPPPLPRRDIRSSLPLAGLTILAVEDSRFAAEALRLLCHRSGARLRRVESLCAAEAHLRCYRPDAVIVDLGLPDGCGETLIRSLARSGGPVILATSGDPARRDAALAAGAHAFLDKPLHSLAQFQATLLAHLPERPMLPSPSEMPLAPDPLSLQEDLAHAADLAAVIDTVPPQPTGYLAAFVVGLARSSADAPLEQAALELLADPARLPHLAAVLADRLAAPARPF